MYDQPGGSWEPIKDLGPGWKELANPEILVLAKVWAEQKQQLEGTDALEQFLARLRREWAIETGILERLYDIDRGTTLLLIEQGLDEALLSHDSVLGNKSQTMSLIRDQHEVAEGLLDFVGGGRPLSAGYIKELHAALTRHQNDCDAVDQFGRTFQAPLRRGEYKLHPNNPTVPGGGVHFYCPPEHVASEMERLVVMHADHEVDGVAPEVEAAWLHHRFSQIHPFQDGNGRVARSLATLVLLKASWFPLVVRREDRVVYLDALEAADAGNLAPLIAMFSAVQKRAFVGALGLARSLPSREPAADIIDKLRADLTRRRQAILAQQQKAKDLADHMNDIAAARLKEVAEELTRKIGDLADQFDFSSYTERRNSDRWFWWRYQIVEIARTHGYFANLREFHAWSRLALRLDGSTSILCSFHSLGQDFRGVVAASVLFFHQTEDDDPVRSISNLVSLTDDIFQINYLESVEEVEVRFRPWFEQAIAAGLDIWRRSI